ncbi:MAG TPA: hypothetical protein VIC60_09235, partial [Thermomicrobiales bacterium]
MQIDGAAPASDRTAEAQIEQTRRIKWVPRPPKAKARQKSADAPTAEPTLRTSDTALLPTSDDRGTNRAAPPGMPIPEGVPPLEPMPIIAALPAPVTPPMVEEMPRPASSPAPAA